ncbi:UNVERIFIED_CONTAM: cytochrome [Sesamum radiatum]|uniref:(+)-piperitol/(+)-sesamin synthase n=1 Tax=Sesamum radiatum TaxID=300843 RepID=A0AAW2KU53_SESRA
MEIQLCFFISPIILLALYSITLHLVNKLRNLPPSPFPTLPFIGHIYLLKLPFHRSLSEVSRRYGPALFLRLGSRSVLLISSPSLAEVCLTKKNDLIFANRPKLLNGRYFGYNYTSLSWSPYGEHWRNLRRISAVELLSAQRMQMLSCIQADETLTLVRKLFHVTREEPDKVLEVKSTIFEFMFNIVTRMITGKRYYGKDVEKKEAKILEEIVSETSKAALETNVVDFLPVMRWFGYKDVEKKLISIHEKRDKFMQNVIEEQRRARSGESEDAAIKSYSKKMKTMVEVLLDLQASEPQIYTDQTIKNLLLVLLQGGSSTSTIALEWAFSLLLDNPQTLKKAQAEIDAHVGYNRLITEADVAELPYLRHIILETLRLHPPASILQPHFSSAECAVGGFRVPAGTILLVNAWEIHHNPKTWADPEKFRPERFEGFGGKRDLGFKFLPFGSGRRACPGENLALTNLGLGLGSLIQCFDWEKVGAIDMREVLVLYSTTLHLVNKLRNLPPSPFPALPFIGHIYLLKQPFHRSLSEVSRRYGPALFLRLGSRSVLLISSPSLAEECLSKKNDLIFANRPNLLNGRYFGCNYTSLPWAPYGEHWKNLRRISAMELLSSQRIQMLSYIRADETLTLVRKLFHVTREDPDKVLEVKSDLFEFMFNVLTRMIMGKRYYGKNVEKSKEAKILEEIESETSKLAFETNVVDFLPMMRRFGYRDVDKKLISICEKRDKFMQSVIEEHRRVRSASAESGDAALTMLSKSKTIVEVLLDLQASEPEYYTDETIRNLLLGLSGVAARRIFNFNNRPGVGVFSTARQSTNPKESPGGDRRSRRPHPSHHGSGRGGAAVSPPHDPRNAASPSTSIDTAAPLLLAECAVGGFRVPAGTILLVNVWEIHHNPKTWADPEKFRPERFEGYDLKRDFGFKFLPFGSGRRACPGENLGLTNIGLGLGSLIQCFDWEKVGEIDMKEGGAGVTAPKVQPLRAKCSPRPFIFNFLS